MGRPRVPGVEDVRYINPITGVVSSSSWYINEQGIKKPIPASKMEYKVNGEWLKPHFAPHIRKHKKKYISSKKGFMMKIHNTMVQKVKERIKRGKLLQGEFEFKDDRRGRCDKLMEAFDEQVERYGDRCPMTHIPFTTDRALERFDINNYARGTFSNISADRIFNHIDYTEQNTLFTSQLWNLKKGVSSISELKFIFMPEVLERYKAIVMERFPDQKYTLRDRGPWIMDHGTGLKDGRIVAEL